MIKRLGIAFMASVVLVIIIAGLWLWDPLTTSFDPDAVRQEANAYQVEIIRDDYGVPHIYGITDADAVFGLGYVNAEDDFETIQEVVAATRGVLARYRGAGAAPTDYIVSLLKVWETIEERYEEDVPSEIKAIARAHAAGVNLYAAQNPDKVWPGLAPFTEKDVIAGFVFKTPFFYGLDETLLALFGDEYQQQIALDPAEDRQSFHLNRRTMAERGSNAFAVAPERSADNKTRLLINSHQPLTGPVAWYEAHLVSQEGLDITGGLFPGSPLILHGFNRHLGWANTVNKPDLADIYVLERNPKNTNQYKLDGEWRDFEKSTSILRIGLFGPFSLKIKRPVLYAAHGPVIEAKHGTYALRYAGMDEIRQLEQYYRLNKATDMESFLESMAMSALPSINYIYADKVGNIGFIHNGQYPDRIEGWDWQKEMPGTRSDLIWQDYHPFRDVPIIINPQSGFVWNANNTPTQATDGPDNLKIQDYPAYYGLQDNMTNRALRIGEQTDGKTPISEDALLDIKFDHHYSERSIAAQVIEDVVARDWSKEPAMRAAIEHLKKWDRGTNKENRQAALAVLTAIHEITEPLTRVPSPPRDVAFREAVQLLMKNYGTVDVAWGEVNRLIYGGKDFPLSGAPDVLRAVYPAEIREDGKFHDNAGDSWIALVEWDEAGRQSAQVINNFGSALEDKSSPHHTDQMSLFVDQKFRKALIQRDDILSASTVQYRPQDK